MKRFVQAFGAPLILAVGLVQGDGRLTATPLAPEVSPSYSVELLPGTQRQALILKSPSVMQYRLLPKTAPSLGSGDKIPHSYTVYGLRTGPGGMAFTDQNGAILPVPSQPRLLMGPEGGAPMRPYYAPLPAPKK